MKFYEIRYGKIEQFFRKRGVLLKSLKMLNKGIPIIAYFSYPLLLLYLILIKDERFFKVLLIPLIAFLFTTIIRKIKNEPRPYEKYDIHPLIQRTKKGESFPSRHTLSIMIIAFAFLYIHKILGIIFILLGLILAIIRIIAGIHFPRDIVAAIVISLIFGGVGFFLW